MVWQSVRWALARADKKPGEIAFGFNKKVDKSFKTTNYS
jgi:hypothetical protein